MSILDKIFGGKSNPMGEANNYLNQIPGVAHAGYDPYVNEGRDASGKTKSTYESLMSDPQGFIDSLLKNYKNSEGYNFQKGELTKELGNAAASGGIAGTPLDQQNQGQAIQGLLSKDMQQYLENALGVFGKGLAGEEGIATRGYDASGKLTDTLGTTLGSQASSAFNNAQQNNKDRNDWINKLIQALGAGAGALGTGGIGGLVAGGLGSDMFGGG